MQSPFDVRHSAILALDCQTGVVSVYAKSDTDFTGRASKVLNAARTAGIMVIQVQFGFRPGLPEVTERNKLVGAIKGSKPHQEFFQGASGAIHPALGPAPDDILIVKHRISAFAGTDLEMILRAREINTLVILGIATSGVVLSTLLQACDSDYHLVLIADCCADLDLDLHSALISRFFPRLANVISADEFVKTIQQLT